ncbi:MAG: 16S rRNA processing protein RimM [Bacteroidetes bacterium]|nr:16S rRNA processing protein RimM [Bacteroidota bacterium]MBT3800567.1 16S rRNA processing protein RimM [Bacteroidota bacterium]MBT3934392.1 16S rRNA processing protein RimM [Bacteroidota bacterium]MBT4968385.1 16S rRNA processing protein RimM [Bacteroidota bacterium]MBT5991657.1 16S rRNA processing protein RimM [Bacteroidota bacterium]
MLQIENIFHAGTITKAHAFSGQIKIVFSSIYKAEKEPQGTVFIMIHKKPVPFFIEECSHFSASSVILKLEDINSIDQAKELIGLEFFLNNTFQTASSDEEFQMAYLKGYSVFDQHNSKIGIVQHIIENPAHYILETADGILIPFHEDLLIELNIEKKAVYLQIPEGLID